jgi:L-glutamine-phosphate cytidylyltransferase
MTKRRGVAKRLPRKPIPSSVNRRQRLMAITKAIILSAGKGSRLLPLTEDRPKCLIEVSGKSLLEWQLASLQANGVEEVVVVTGFRDDLVDEVAARWPGVRTLFNPFYHVADNLGSVWLARAEFDRDVLLLNGDTLVSRTLVAKVLAASPHAVAVTVDEKDEYDADDMKVLREGDRLLHIGKALEPGQYNAESIGFLAFRGEGPHLFTEQVERMMHTPDGTRRWYLRAIDALAQETEVHTVSIKGEDWQEVDFHEDVAKAEELTARWAAAEPGNRKRA